MSAILSLASAALLFASSAAAGPNAVSKTTHPTSAASAPATGALPWIEDDYARAVVEAKRRGLPIFVEAWAPW
jgi:hypothetical protein